MIFDWSRNPPGLFSAVLFLNLSFIPVQTARIAWVVYRFEVLTINYTGTAWKARDSPNRINSSW
ncbi:hypothetical protein PF005_g16903 [Phytophthora fragariae]|uniref:Uncharacterized protein n=1 Tax=Phytophthora fragariae TaxID=53985 RepID=A0A6A3X523_9STRA|nr:hypothetical protein PF003_g36333 [Phytophthora fragariae]KAE8931802.1 hypothetical protein PF009_g18156 [Phytophthora fragariae]KAE8998267.1 hypothetical protein PF011_g15130 [Phytophthora fragariae]KAE9096619.1 hypothetical protein PF010_g16283 [Phytophthora fragariae]KAE9107973.1 hypothetical protein PF007_g12836 [Phytophthora fragariae]